MMFAHYTAMHKHTQTHKHTLERALPLAALPLRLTTFAQRFAVTLCHTQHNSKQRTLVNFLFFDYFALFALHIIPCSRVPIFLPSALSFLLLQLIFVPMNA